MMLRCLFIASLPLVAFAQDQDPPRVREYDVAALLRPLSDRPAPYLGMLHGLAADGVPEPDLEPPAFGDVSPVDAEMIVDLVRELTGVEWDEETTSIELAPTLKLLVNQADDVHKKIARIVPTLAATFAPEIAIDATVVEIKSGLLGEIVSGAHGVLPDERVARLQESIRAGADAANVRRLRLVARPPQRTHVKAVEDTSYLADVDLVAGGEKPVYKSVTRSVRTGCTLEIRPMPYDGAIVLDWRFVEARLDGDADTIESIGSVKIQMPRVRRRAMGGELLVPNTSTGFAGAMPLPGKPGWMVALFLRPQIEAAGKEKPFEPDGDVVLGFYNAAPLVGVADDDTPLRLTGDELANVIKTTMEPELWDEADGCSIVFNNGWLIVRNSKQMHKKMAAFMTERRRDVAAVALELKLVKATAAALGEAAVGEAMTPRTIEKLLAKAAAGDGASIAWETAVHSATRYPVAMEDRTRRPIVAAYPVDGGEPDPQIGVAEWGATVRVLPVAPDKAGGRISLRGLTAEFTTAGEPFPTAAAAGKLHVHLPKSATVSFTADSEVEPGAWTSVGMSASGGETLVLLVRATAP